MTDAALLAPMSDRSARPTATIEIVLPVHDEVAALEPSVRRLHTYLADRFPLSWEITIADNASTDGTWDLACALVDELDGVQAVHLDRKGRGQALRTTWSASRSPVVTYMDVDLSTDLDALLPLVAPLVSGHSDIAIGSRLASGSRVVRGPRREAISRGYNLLLKMTLRSGFSDAQCGFKAMRTDVARRLLDMVEDQGWFFDTELLVLAERNGFRIHEVPVDWVDDPDSRVDVVSTAVADLQGIGRMVRSFARGGGLVPATNADRDRRPDADLAGQLVRFASIGGVSTVVFALLFAVLAGPLGPVAANVVALGACTFANTAANRRLTFALRGRRGRRRSYAAGTALTVLPLAATLGVLFVLGVAGVTSLTAQLVALTATNAAATLGRFLALRHWVFREDVPTTVPENAP